MAERETPITRFGLRSFLFLAIIILSTIQFVNLFRLTNDINGGAEYNAQALRNTGVKLDVIERSINELSSKFQRDTSEINDKLEATMEFIQSFNKTAARQSSQSSQATTRIKEKNPYQYTPSLLEQYFIDNAKSLGLHKNKAIATCPLVTSKDSPISKEMTTYMNDLGIYNRLMKNFTPVTYDLRTKLERDNSNIEQVCEATKIHPDGLNGVFKQGISSSTDAGGMEPLLPIMRSFKICNKRPVSLASVFISCYIVQLPSTHTSFSFQYKFMLNMEYLVHDFHAMCLMLQKHSRTVFIDMGASLDFHEDVDIVESPAIYINAVYSLFGFQFDHIYAYEMKVTEPVQVFERVPNELMNSFHWINVGE